jgi:hypothetical protein
MSRSRRQSPHNSNRSLWSPRTRISRPVDSTKRHPAGTLTVISGGPAMVSRRAAPPGAGNSATEAVATTIEQITGRRLSRNRASDRIDANHLCTHLVVRREPSMVKRRRLTRKRRVRLRAPPYGDVAMAAHGSAVAAWREGAVGRDRGEGLERGKEPARLAVRRAVPAELGDRSHGAGAWSEATGLLRSHALQVRLPVGVRPSPLRLRRAWDRSRESVAAASAWQEVSRSCVNPTCWRTSMRPRAPAEPVEKLEAAAPDLCVTSAACPAWLSVAKCLGFRWKDTMLGGRAVIGRSRSTLSRRPRVGRRRDSPTA